MVTWFSNNLALKMLRQQLGIMLWWCAWHEKGWTDLHALQGDDAGGDKKTLERLTGLADQLVATGDYSILTTSCVERFTVISFSGCLSTFSTFEFWMDQWEMRNITAQPLDHVRMFDVMSLSSMLIGQSKIQMLRSGQATPKNMVYIYILVAPRKGTHFVLDTVQLSTRTHLKR